MLASNPDFSALLAPIDAGAILLEQLDASHRQAVRAICPIDDPVWDIYPVRMAGDDFDPEFNSVLANPQRQPFVIFEKGLVRGISGYLHIDLANRALEIGGTYLTPDSRGTGLNGAVKRLLVGRAFSCGFSRIEFRIDARNIRSQRAVEKLGAMREGVLRRNRITWTGFVRDTAVYSILAGDWQA